MLTTEEIFTLAEPFGAFQYGDAQGDKRIAFARVIEHAACEDLNAEIDRMRKAAEEHGAALQCAGTAAGLFAGDDLHRDLVPAIDRLTRERNEALAERDALANVLPGYYYMDPPDGGDVPILEQLRRMAKDAERARYLFDHCVVEVSGTGDLGIRFSCDFENYDNVRAAIDAALALAQAKEQEA